MHFARQLFIHRNSCWAVVRFVCLLLMPNLYCRSNETVALSRQAVRIESMIAGMNIEQSKQFAAVSVSQLFISSSLKSTWYNLTVSSRQRWPCEFGINISFCVCIFVLPINRIWLSLCLAVYSPIWSSEAWSSRARLYRWSRCYSTATRETASWTISCLHVLNCSWVPSCSCLIIFF